LVAEIASELRGRPASPRRHEPDDFPDGEDRQHAPRQDAEERELEESPDHREDDDAAFRRTVAPLSATTT
jgi:hypothetical protein